MPRARFATVPCATTQTTHTQPACAATVGEHMDAATTPDHSCTAVGGGGLLVPLYSIVLGLGPSLAAPVSKATIFGVALGVRRARRSNMNPPHWTIAWTV